MIPSYKIEEIREKASIVSVVSDFIDVKKKGSRFIGLCPFHKEKTPSFSLTPEKNLYYCFGCHVGGDTFDFIMRYEGVDFQKAAVYLAHKNGIQLKEESKFVHKINKEHLYIEKINLVAQEFFYNNLWSKQGKKAQAYLKLRNILKEESLLWKIGFGGTHKHFLDHIKYKNISIEDAQKAGLLSENRRFLFSDRLIFSIYSENNILVGFGGRILYENKHPKYINSSESLLFNKRELLYGIEKASKAIRRKKKMVLVEGYMDVLACHKSDIKNAVATLGTAFTNQHLNECKRFTKELILLFDGDRSGLQATFETSKLLLKEKIKTSIVPLQKGMDPDKLLQKIGVQKLKEKMDQALPVLEYFIQICFSGIESIEDKIKAASRLAPLLSSLPKGLEKDLYISKIASKIGVSTEELQNHFKKIHKVEDKKNISYKKKKILHKKEDDSEKIFLQEWNILQEILLYPQLIERLNEFLEYTSEKMTGLINDLIKPNEHANVYEQIAEYINDEKILNKIKNKAPIENTDIESLNIQAEKTFTDILDRFKYFYLKKTRDKLLEEIKIKESQDKNIDDLIVRLKNITRYSRKLKRSL